MGLDELDLEKIKQIRLDKKISIEELSLALGYETRYGYQHVEKGRRKLKAGKMPTLSRLLETPIDDLYKNNSNLAGMDKSVK